MSNIILTNKVYEKYSGEPRMFFGEGRGIQEFIDTPYPEFLKLKDQQQAQDWPHDEFTLKQDALDLAVADQATKHIFTSNIQSQIFADSVQGRGPAWLIPYCSDPSLEGLLIEWSRVEWLHSRTYTNILVSLYSNPSLVTNMIETKPEIFQRFSQCTQAYEDFFNNPNKENLVILMAAINILEGLAFYASFACNYAFASAGKFESVAKFLTLINKDEHLHVAFTQRIIKNWKSGKDGQEWKEAWYDNIDKITNMFLSGLEEERTWNEYLFQYGSPSTLLSAKKLNDYNEFKTSQRMRNLGLKLNTSVTKDPLPWIQLKFTSQKGIAHAPQETKVPSYLKNPIDRLEDLSELQKLNF